MFGVDDNSRNYYLSFWGQVENDRWVERDLGITEKEFWFATKAERDELKAKLTACAQSHNCIIVFKEADGPEVHLRTVARMVFRLPDGREFPFKYDFGYAYEPEMAEFMFCEGNYACDCNRSLFLSRDGFDVPVMGCDFEIELVAFEVTQESRCKS